MYKMLVKDKMNPFLHMELNLKESQKYVKQGRTYTSTLMNLCISWKRIGLTDSWGSLQHVNGRFCIQYRIFPIS